MSDPTRWSATQVQALAPDSSSFAAARKLAAAKGWSGDGYSGQDGAGEDDSDPPSLWGLCQGSGKSPYQTCIDLGEPAYRCSCPSRKFPCKHALALLLRWSQGEVATAESPDWVREWHAGRAARKAERAATPRTEAQVKAAERRSEQRQERVAAGVTELREWLGDQVRHGIAGMDQTGYRHVEPVAARLVDAQAPGLAGAVRRIAAVAASGAGWEQRMLAELSLLHLLTTAAQAVEHLPQDLADTVRARVGLPVPSEKVLASVPVRDRWQVIGGYDEQDEQVTTRRTWLIGRDSGRAALVLTFAAFGQALAADLIPGTSIDADLCFYPGSTLRALVSQRYGSLEPCPAPIGAHTVRRAQHRLAAALAADPWLTSYPLLLTAALVPGRPWQLVDEDGDALALDPATGEPWAHAAIAGGRLVTVAAEWTPPGLRILAVYSDQEVAA